MALIGVLVAGACLALGALLVVSAFRPGPPVPERGVEATKRLVPLALRWTIAAVVTVVVLVSSGWLLPALVCGAIAWWVSSMFLERGAGNADDVQRVEALATWTEQLRDVLMAGDQPIGAIQATVATCPDPIRAEVRALAARLGRQPEQVVLRRFADDLDDPTADLIAAGLLVAIERGGRAERVLSSLAAQARHQADRRKLLEAERAPARREVWWVTALMAAQLVGGFALARSEYLRPYQTLRGQTVLAVLLITFLGLVLYVQRLSRFERPARFLTLRSEQWT